ncbi:MAG: tetratricopeptide repeat protein [Pseudomonadota bacterium]
MEQERLRYQFGPFTLDVHAGVLMGVEGDIKLRPQAFRVLLYLLQQHARIVPRDELLDAVWGSEHLSANSLPQVISELRQALCDDTREPRYIATVHRRGYRFVAPTATCDGAPSEAAASSPPPLEARDAPSLPAASKDMETSPARRMPAALAAVALLAGATVALSLQQRSTAPAPTAPASADGRLLVLPLHQTAPGASTAWLATAMADALGRELGRSRELEVLSPQRTARVQTDLELSASDSLSPATVRRVERRTGARWVVTGAVSPLADAGAMRLEVRVRDTLRIDAVATHTSEFTVAQWPDAASHAAAELRQRLGLRPPDALREGPGLAQAPTNPSAAPAYHSALSRSRQFDLAAALQQLTVAEAADPASAHIASALAQVHGARGETARAQHYAGRAAELAKHWRASEQLPLRAQALRLAGQPIAAADLYRQAYEAQRALQMGLDLAGALSDAGQGESALGHLEGMREEAGNATDRLLIALEVAVVAETIGEFLLQRQAAEDALQIATALGAQWHEGQARRQLGLAQLRLGNAQEASALFSRAFDMLQMLGDLPSASQVSANWALALMDTGALELARSKLDQALTLAQRTEHISLAAEHTSQLGALALYAGEGEKARALQEQALASFAANGDRRGEAQARLRYADGIGRAGDFDRALALMRESRGLFQQIGDLHGEARAWDMLGAMLGRSGSLDAQRHFERALELYRESGDRRGEADALGHLGSQYSSRGQFEPAVAHMSEALDLYQRIPSKRGAAKVMYNLSLVHLRTGAVAEAARLLGDAQQAFAELELAGNAAWVQRKYGDVLMHQGKLEPAREALDGALTATRESGAKVAIAHALSSLGDLAVFEGDRVAARALHEQARDMRESMRQYGNAAANEMALVRLALDRSDFAEAQRALDVATSALETNIQGWRAVLLALQARLEAARGLPELARTSLSEAVSALEESASEDASMRLIMDLEIGRALGALGEHDAAMATLAEVGATAEGYGFVARAMEARLARFDVMADASGPAPAAEPALRLLAEQAEAAGFIAIAQRAAALVRVAEASTRSMPAEAQVN